MHYRYALIAAAFIALPAPFTNALSAESSLFSARNPEAPAGVDQYGQFAGTWTCTPSSRGDDGTMKESKARPSWVWHYVLNGHAIQDIWLPDAEHSRPGAAMGTNLRVYNSEKDEWTMVWTTEPMGAFQTFTARMKEGEIVMRGKIPEGQFPAHLSRITFHNISEDHFDWKYEASAPHDGVNWQLHSTLSCDRTAH